MTAPGRLRQSQLDELLTPDEVCALFKVTKDWLYDEVEAGRITHVRLGRQLRFDEAEIQAYLAARTVTAVSTSTHTHAEPRPEGTSQ